MYYALTKETKKRTTRSYPRAYPSRFRISIYIYLFNETRTYPSSSVPSFKQQYIDVCIMKFAWKAVVSCPKTQLFFVKETKKEKNFIRDEKCVSFKNNWLIGKGSSFSSSSSSSCVCYILSSLLRQLSLLHQDGERLFSANDVLLLLFVP